MKENAGEDIIKGVRREREARGRAKKEKNNGGESF